MLLCCVEDAVHQVVGSQILIGYEPKDSNYPWLLVCSCRPKLEVLFCLRDFLCLCVRCVSDLEKGACPANTFDLPIVVRMELQIKTDHFLSWRFSEKIRITHSSQNLFADQSLTKSILEISNHHDKMSSTHHHNHSQVPPNSQIDTTNPFL